MYYINFNHPEYIHFIGIGGISMSGLAEILLDRGFQVSGSDMGESEITEHLKKKGAQVFIGQVAENISSDMKVVVYTAAIHPDNQEYQAAAAAGIPMLTRAELLGQLMKNYKEAVAVSGTHGKTTTTSMLTEILLDAAKDPTISVGGMLDSIGGNVRIGRSDCFVTEACEYTNSFLSFYPTVAAVLNIKEDHLDFFKDIQDIRQSFRRFMELVPASGSVIVNDEIDDLDTLVEGLSCEIVRFGQKPDSQFHAMDVSYDQEGCPSFLLKDTRQAAPVCFERIFLKVPGAHNLADALAAAALAFVLRIPFASIKAGLENFHGAHRRFEHKGDVAGITVIDDYAHHPDEIKAALAAAKRCSYHELWCVFQPHTYTRTKAFLHEFAAALSAADHVILADIYPARETDTLGVSSEDIHRLLVKMGVDSHYLPTFRQIEKFVLDICQPGDMLITMGAGDVVKVGEDLLKN